MRDTTHVLSTLLKRSGHDVRTAADGPSGLIAALEFRPNIILMDIGLPGIDGYEVAKRIRQEPTLKQVVLVALTGYGGELDRHRSHAAGFDHHLVKPADINKIRPILATVPQEWT
jgi:CheY-like chemotaxis protein